MKNLINLINQFFIIYNCIIHIIQIEITYTFAT